MPIKHIALLNSGRDAPNVNTTDEARRNATAAAIDRALPEQIQE
jgi:hypothetical protein